MQATRSIREKALELGFDLAGFAPVAPIERAEAFRSWLHNGFHGGLDWLARSPERRIDPGRVLPGARSVVVVGMSYYSADPDPALWNDPLRGRIARYAWGRDYHKVMGKALKALAACIEQETGGTCRWYVDTGPVLEREWGWRSGLGFVGRNSLLIHPRYGSYVFLGEVFVDRELDYDAPAAENGAALAFDNKNASCGSCKRCLEACPTGAITAPYVLDSRRCISFLTIECKGAIPEALRPRMGNWLYGCDACQACCPWVRRFSRIGRARFLEADPEGYAPELIPLLEMSEDDFHARFQGTPIRRIKRSRFLRNAAVALGNSGRPEALPALERAASDPDPLIREHARWAVRRLRNEPPPQLTGFPNQSPASSG